MDSLGIANPPIVIKPVQAAPQGVPSAPKADVPALPVAGADSAAFDPVAAEQQRLQAVQRAAQSLSEIFVVSDRTFTIFKDASGQYVTRFTSLRDGKVTYIPEPNLFRIGGESDSTSVKIKV